MLSRVRGDGVRRGSQFTLVLSGVLIGTGLALLVNGHWWGVALLATGAGVLLASRHLGKGRNAGWGRRDRASGRATLREPREEEPGR